MLDSTSGVEGFRIMSEKGIQREDDRILVVDDDAGIRESLGHSLQMEGYSVQCACGYEEALRSLRQSGTLLAMVDLRMPGRSGIDLVREIRRQGRSLPIIVLSGLSTPSEAAE